MGLFGASGPAYAASEKVLHAFEGTDGGRPLAGLTDVDGTLYGTTFEGGSSNVGTVFKVTTAGVETVVYSFKAGTKDGANPAASLVNLGGTLYGTTLYGGRSTNCSSPITSGCGTVFKVTPAGVGKVLHSFDGGSLDGAVPAASLINLGGALYGTTSLGGSDFGNGSGIVFKITKAGAETILHFFDGTDGAGPVAGLTKVGGALYGTTSENGGSTGDGTVFKATTAGAVTVLYSFKGASFGDGTEPAAGLIKVGDTFYGTTAAGGAYNKGTVFSVTIAGVETVLYSFKGGRDGSNPFSGLINVGGVLYGTTDAGGTSGNGTVFKVTTDGAEKILYSFKGGADGASPDSGLINVGGTLYGTTSSGGGPAHCRIGFCGIVFAITP